MSPALANFVFEAANVLLLAAALGWMLFKPVRRALDAERDRHARADAESQRLRAEAEALTREARAAREQAVHEAAAQRAAAEEEAQRAAARLLAQARDAEAGERRALEREFDAARAAQLAALADDVGRIAAESVAGLLDAIDGPPLDLALVRAACAELRALPREACARALVESARPLDPEARDLLRGVLGEGFRERIVDELRAGVRVTTSAGQVDATAPALARRAAHAVGSAAAREAGGTDG